MNMPEEYRIEELKRLISTIKWDLNIIKDEHLKTRKIKTLDVLQKELEFLNNDQLAS